MPLNLTSLKNILPLNSSFRRWIRNVTIASFFSLSCHAFNPFNLGKEFEEKLTAQQLLASTKYYALGTRFKAGQTWDEKKFQDLLTKSNFRLRDTDQVLLADDALRLTHGQCEGSLGAAFTELNLTTMPEAYCWKWMNKKTGTQLVIIQDNLIKATFAASSSDTPLQKSLEASFDPKLVAQYKNNEPLIQEEKKLSDIPVACLNGVMAIEDNDFLDHSGVSYTGLARALFKNITSLKKAQGGSTITQQLVKNYFLTPEKSFTRKAKELYMSIRLESQWTKDEILQTYLNVIYMGQSGVFQVRGFPAASRFYFDKPIDQLNLPECALLAAIINNPLQNNPWKSKDHSLSRRNLVLKKMLELKLISEKEHGEAIAASLPPLHETQASETAPYYFEATRDQARELGISIEGKSFYTTLDLDLQSAAQKALAEGIQKVTYSRDKLKLQKGKGVELQGAILSSENDTGNVNAFVGGQNYKTTQYNRALNGRRQIGSLVKPFIYLSGLLHGDYTPTSVLQDEAFTWEYDKKKWSPVNYDKKFRGPVPYYYALKESLNSPTAQVAQKAGLDNIINLMKKAGFKSDIPLYPSISLGVSEHTPMEVLQAYQTLARIGNYKKISFIHQVEDESGKIIFKSTDKDSSDQALDERKVSALIAMMKQTLQTGTAKSLATLPFSAISAGKTGTTTQGRDTWFSGFTPRVTTVVWIGFDQNLPTTLTGASGAVPIWANYMKTAQLKYGTEDFKYSSEVFNREFDFPEVKEKVNLLIE